MSRKFNFKMCADLLEDVYRIMDKIDSLEKLARDENNNADIKQVLLKEVRFQKKDLTEVKSLMKNNEEDFVRVIYYKYIEGYTLEEAAEEVHLSSSTMRRHHAEFTSYLKIPKEEREKYVPISAVKFRRFLNELEQLLRPKYETCCLQCGSPTVIPSDLVKKIIRTEVNKENVLKRSSRRSGRKTK